MVKDSKARATREDSDQESLVSKKDEINQRTSKIIDLLIETKNSWNGKPAPGIGVSEPTSIKEPLPEETASTMKQILQMVQDVDSKLKDIDNQQAGYSVSRRRPKPNKQQSISRSRSKPENQLSEDKLDLSAIASSSVSRFMSHIKAPFQFGDSKKWERLRLLRAASRIKSNLDEIQSFVLSSDVAAIPNAIHTTKNLFFIFDNEIAEPILANLHKMPKKNQNDSGKSKSENSEKTKSYEADTDTDTDTEASAEAEAEAEAEGFSIPEMENSEAFNQAQLIDVTSEISLAIRDIEDALMRLTTTSLRIQFKKRYHDLRKMVSQIISLNTSEPSQAQDLFMRFSPVKDQFISDVYELTPNITEEGFETTANRFSNFINRKKVEYLNPSSDQTKVLRLKSDEVINESKKALSDLMDALQKSYINPGSLTSYVNTVTLKLDNVYKSLFRLGSAYNSRAKMHNYKAKGKDKMPIVSSTDLQSVYKGIKDTESLRNRLYLAERSYG